LTRAKAWCQTDGLPGPGPPVTEINLGSLLKVGSGHCRDLRVGFKSDGLFSQAGLQAWGFSWGVLRKLPGGAPAFRTTRRGIKRSCPGFETSGGVRGTGPNRPGSVCTGSVAEFRVGRTLRRVFGQKTVHGNGRGVWNKSRPIAWPRHDRVSLKRASARPGTEKKKLDFPPKKAFETA